MALTEAKSGVEGGGVETSNGRKTLVDTSSPQTRLLRSLVSEIDNQLQSRLMDVAELTAADEWRWVSARRQILKLLNEHARLRVNAINNVLELVGENDG